MNEELKEVTIYTDGAAEPNPGPGGYGVVLIYGKHRKELWGGFRRTTNNRMEVLAAIKGLEALKMPCKVTLYSDSKYLVDAMNRGWARRWRAKGWRRARRGKAVNVDLWERLLTLSGTHQVEFVWVKGHAGNRENERCDELSLRALKRTDLPADEVYEQQPESEVENPKQRRETEVPPKVKITHEGQPCRSCSAPVVKRTPRRTRKRGQEYHFEYYFYCPKCHAMYMVEDAKRYYDQPPPTADSAHDAEFSLDLLDGIGDESGEPMNPAGE